MSSTVVVTMAASKTSSSCPSCGDTLPCPDTSSSSHEELAQAQARIADLESQLRVLSSKAEAAVGRWASYEEELTRLRDQKGTTSPPPPPPPKTGPSTPDNNKSSSGGGGFLQAGSGRISALLYRGNSNSSARSSPDRNGGPVSTDDLLQALTREQSLRKEAEGRLNATSHEIEELSASLFEQANEMVAEERRARAKLEERVDELERRDTDKRRRLERLESAMNRIEKVRKILDGDK